MDISQIVTLGLKERIPDTARGFDKRLKPVARIKKGYKRRLPGDFKAREYHPKTFIAWDGEGVNQDDSWQRYVVFGSSMGDFLSAHDLRTVEILELLVDSAHSHPDCINVIFGGDYDANMILRDVDKHAIKVLHEKGEIWNWRGYHITYIPHKIFSVWKHKKFGGKGKRATFTWYDVFTFFSTSFVKALKDYEAVDGVVIDFIESGKSLRGQFTDSMVDDVVLPYWRKELESLVALCNKLEESLYGAAIDLDSYHGPGAVADFLLKKNHVRFAMPTYEPSEELQYAIQCAYAGGRFELFQMGRYPGRVYQYDIRSAYPHAIRKLPSLKGARWIYQKGTPAEIHPWSLYKLERWDNGHPWNPNPYYYRTRTSNIIFPFEVGSGWHYGIEIQPADLAFITEYWYLEHDETVPFEFVEELYDWRAEQKRLGNPAQKAAKLGLNSFYGKFAQRIGANNGPPKWHVLEWAGMVTAHCRNQLFQAIQQAGDSIIAVETDSIFCTRPLRLPMGDALGEWEGIELDEILYLQNGLYFSNSRTVNNRTAKIRGLGPGSVTYEMACEYLSAGIQNSEALTSYVHRFRTMGSCLIQYYDKWPGQWCRWEDIRKDIRITSLQGKRVHTHCDACKRKVGMLEGLHQLHVNSYVNTWSRESQPHKLEWMDSEVFDDPRNDDFEMV